MESAPMESAAMESAPTESAGAALEPHQDHFPTSPADSSPWAPPQVDQTTAAFEPPAMAAIDTTEVVDGPNRGTERTEVEFTEPAEVDFTEPAEATERAEGCPLLLSGANFAKALRLRPDRWYSVGRAAESHLLLESKGVSRKHLMLRWDPARRVVELRENSNTTGTLLNGEKIHKVRKELVHNDRLCIQGKGKLSYDLKLDMSFVGSVVSDPVSERLEFRAGARKLDKATAVANSRRLEDLRVQLKHLKASSAAYDEAIAAKERGLAELAERSRKRKEKDRETQEKIEKLLASQREMEDIRLEQGRQEWVTRLREQHGENELASAALVVALQTQQEKVEKLQLKKDELERTIHPERYAVVDALRLGLVDAPPARAEVKQAGPAASASPSENEGEEQYDLGGGASSSEPVRPAEAASRKRLTKAEAEDGEPSKRPRPGWAKTEQAEGGAPVAERPAAATEADTWALD